MEDDTFSFWTRVSSCFLIRKRLAGTPCPRWPRTCRSSWPLRAAACCGARARRSGPTWWMTRTWRAGRRLGAAFFMGAGGEGGEGEGAQKIFIKPLLRPYLGLISYLGSLPLPLSLPPPPPKCLGGRLIHWQSQTPPQMPPMNMEPDVREMAPLKRTMIQTRTPQTSGSIFISCWEGMLKGTSPDFRRNLNRGFTLCLIGLCIPELQWFRVHATC